MEAVFGPVDVLVANHGRSQIARIEDVDAAAFDRCSPSTCARRSCSPVACCPAMRERGFGRVLFMSSVAGLTGGIVGPHYAASKAGLHGLTHYLARRSPATA